MDDEALDRIAGKIIALKGEIEHELEALSAADSGLLSYLQQQVTAIRVLEQKVSTLERKIG